MDYASIWPSNGWGRDAKGNDSIVKKHLSLGDRYLHADMHGAPSSLRNKFGFITDTQPPAHIGEDMPAFRLVDKIDADLDDEPLNWLQLWHFLGVEHGMAVSARNCVLVKPGQVSKSAETGEYVGKGAFVIRAKNMGKDIDLRLELTCSNQWNTIAYGINNRPHSRNLQSLHCSNTGREKKESIANKITNQPVWP